MNRKLNRRKMLITCSMTGLAAVSPSLDTAVKENKSSRKLDTACYSNVAAMKKDQKLMIGDVVSTFGFYKVGDGGEATYLVVSVITLETREEYGDAMVK